jgi:hypothetical protein
MAGRHPSRISYRSQTSCPSHPAAGNDPVTLPAYMALAKELMAGG